MSRFLTRNNRSSEMLVDFVGKVENYEQDIAVVFSRIGLPRPDSLAHANPSKAKSFSYFYRNPDDIRVIYDKYRSDFDLFGYTLESGLERLD